MRFVITHGHIFKNAGTTFDSSLEKAFGGDFLDHRDDVSMRQGGADYLHQLIIDNPNIKAISSHHLCNPLPKSDLYKCIPVYFVRNPIDRVLSVYNFERKQKKGSKGAEMASKLSLIDYVHWRMSDAAPKVISNYQTAYIGRTRKLFNHEAVGLDIFTRALDIVVNEKALIGTVERFDESFTYIVTKLKNYFPDVDFSYQMKNVNNKNSLEDKYRQALTELQPVLPQIIAANAYDMAIYRAASEKLDGFLSL